MILYLLKKERLSSDSFLKTSLKRAASKLGIVTSNIFMFFSNKLELIWQNSRTSEVSKKEIFSSKGSLILNENKSKNFSVKGLSKNTYELGTLTSVGRIATKYLVRWSKLTKDIALADIWLKASRPFSKDSNLTNTNFSVSEFIQFLQSNHNLKHQ